MNRIYIVLTTWLFPEVCPEHSEWSKNAFELISSESISRTIKVITLDTREVSADLMVLLQQSVGYSSGPTLACIPLLKGQFNHGHMK